MKKSLLVGNGINITASGIQKWDDLIKALFEKCAPDYSYDENKINSLSNIDRYELLFRNSKVDREYIKKYTDDLLKNIEEQPNRLFIEKAFDMYDEIITTNYDLSFEQVAYEKCGNSGTCRNYVDFLPKSIEQRNSLSRYATVPFNGNEKVIWHIHGAYSLKEYKTQSKNIRLKTTHESICFDRELYCSNLDVLMRSFHSRSEDPIYSINTGNTEQGSSIDFKNWGHFFYFRDIDIIGLGLSRDELDLWWMLSYRAYSKSQKIQINNRIRYFCIDERLLDKNQKLDENDRKKVEDNFLARMELLESLDVETVIIDPNEINDINNPYKNPDYYMHCLELAN